MTERTASKLDEWRELMVAALYDELEPDDRRRLDARLETDSELAAEWRELVETRESLRGCQVLGSEDVLHKSSDPKTWHPFELPPLPERAPAPPTGRVVPLRRWWLPAVGGFAAAAALFVGFLIAGLRVDHTPQGWLVGFAPALEEQVAAAIDDAGSEPESAAAVAVPPDLLTREEFATFAELMLRVTDDRLTTLEQRQQDVQAELASALYTALATSQQQQYDDLRLRLQLVATGWAPNRGAGPTPAGGQLEDGTTDGGTHDQRY